MSDFLNARGRISSVEAKTAKNGNTFWKIDFSIEGKQYPMRMTTFDNPDDPKCGGLIEIGYTEKESTEINPKSGKPYINRTAYLPNHIKRAAVPGAAPKAPVAHQAGQVNLQMIADIAAAKAVTDHEKRFHSTGGLPVEIPDDV